MEISFHYPLNVSSITLRSFYNCFYSSSTAVTPISPPNKFLLIQVERLCSLRSLKIFRWLIICSFLIIKIVLRVTKRQLPITHTVQQTSNVHFWHESRSIYACTAEKIILLSGSRHSSMATHLIGMISAVCLRSFYLHYFYASLVKYLETSVCYLAVKLICVTTEALVFYPDCLSF